MTPYRSAMNDPTSSTSRRAMRCRQSNTTIKELRRPTTFKGIGVFLESTCEGIYLIGVVHVNKFFSHIVIILCVEILLYKSVPEDE